MGPLAGTLGALGVSRRALINPASLLGGTGDFYWPGGRTGLFTDTGLTTAVSGTSAVAGISSTLPGTRTGTQATSGARPTYTEDGGDAYLSCDGGDQLTTNVIPASSMTMACKIRPSLAAVQVIFGAASAASDQRSFIGTSASGALAAGVGSQGVGVISAGSSIQNQTVVALLRFNGTTVQLWLNGALIYSAAQSGAPQATYGLGIGSGNFGGTITAPYTGRIYNAFSVARYVTDSEVVQLMAALA